MLELNIIPSELKKEIKIKELIKSIDLIVYIITFSIIFYEIVLFGSQLFLQNYLSEISSQNTIVTRNTDNYSKQVKDINKQISCIDTIQKENIKWSSLLSTLLNSIPEDIKLRSALLNKKDDSLFISGVAGTRDSLISLRKYFENSNNFNLISFPVQNLVEKRNINFEVSLKINSYTPEKN